MRLREAKRVKVGDELFYRHKRSVLTVMSIIERPTDAPVDDKVKYPLFATEEGEITYLHFAYGYAHPIGG